LSGFGVLTLLGVGAITAGCSAQASAEFSNDGNGEPTSPGEDNGGETKFGGTDASAGLTAVVRGSPLCGVTDEKCDPDDDGLPKNNTNPPPANEPASPNPTTSVCAPPDAGTSSSSSGGTVSDASLLANACRVGKIANDGYAPVNCQLADRGGSDGAACQRGSDCAPGFECIDSDKGGVCRRYCCSGSCGDHTSQNGGPTFCDIQTQLDVSHKAPVCMPLKKCKLLRAGECTANETCAIVTEKGDTGCVPKGTVKAGGSCDEDHCASAAGTEELTCLGTPGDRRCYQLCRMDGSGIPCPADQRCATGAAFQDTSFGVCRTPPQAR
jgi:hypothetical protein